MTHIAHWNACCSYLRAKVGFTLLVYAGSRKSNEAAAGLSGHYSPQNEARCSSFWQIKVVCLLCGGDLRASHRRFDRTPESIHHCIQMKNLISSCYIKVLKWLDSHLRQWARRQTACMLVVDRVPLTLNARVLLYLRRVLVVRPVSPENSGLNALGPSI